MKLYRRTKYAIGWKGKYDPKRDAARSIDKRGHLDLAWGEGGPADGPNQPPPITTIRELDKHLRVPRGIHAGRPKQDRGRNMLEQRAHSETFEDRRLSQILGVRRASVGGVQPKGSITIRQILALPDYAVGGRRIDKKAIAKDFRRGIEKTSGKRARAAQTERRENGDGDDSGSSPMGLLGLFLMALDLVVKRINRKKKRR